MKQGATVIIKKLAAVENPGVATAEKHEYVCGSGTNTKSPPVEYEVEGRLMNDVAVGEAVKLDRWRRNEVVTNGQFMTSPVVKVSADGFETMNSKYSLQVLAPA